MPSWIEAIFAFFFKYTPAVFAKGELVFGAPTQVRVLLAIGILIAVPAVLTYAGVRGRSTRRDRWTLGALRVGVVVILMLCLFRPQLHVSEAMKLRNFVAVLVDDSRSMQIADLDGKPRSDVVKRLFAKDSTLLKALSEKWQLRFFKFGNSTDRIEQVVGLGYTAPETHVVDALERVCQEMEAVPMSGIVLVSDGADNSKSAIADKLNALRAKCAPVFAIGTGDAKFKRDAEVRRVEAPRTVLKGTSLTADVMISARGLAGQRLPIVIEDNGRIISQDSIPMPEDGEVVMRRVHAKLDRPGPRLLTFRIPLQKDEQVTQNNTFTLLVNVRDAIEKVLYLEGEPRYEIGFIRRAIGADSNVQLVSVTRTAEGTQNMYLRLGVSDSAEMREGFPKTKAELFKYRSVVIGSIEASAFDHEQLQMLADFVSVRGGGMLFLGGRKSFTEGGYAGTPVADVMPVKLQGDAVADSMTFIADLRVGVTPAGAAMSITDIDKGADRSARRWGQLPTVTSVNYLPRTTLKPGAITLLEGAVDGEGRSEFPNQVVGDSYRQPILVYHHFGRGVAVALPIQDTYHWQMNPAADEKDDMFNTFWRQMMRWLIADVPNRVQITVPNDQVNPGSSIAFRADVADSVFAPKNDVDVIAQVRGPDGIAKEVPMSWAVDRDGEYRASFTPTDTGLHKIVVMATAKDGPAIRDSVMVRMGDLNTEFVDAEMHESLLKRIAEETDGKLYKADNTKSLPADLALSKAGVTKMNQFDLWDMPILFFLMLGLVTAEWAYRKLRGLA